MTNDLAIKILRGEVLGTNEQTHEAVFMAIKALKEQSDVDVIRGKFSCIKQIPKRFCKEQGIMCELTTDSGYCGITGCVREPRGIR